MPGRSERSPVTIVSKPSRIRSTDEVPLLRSSFLEKVTAPSVDLEEDDDDVAAIWNDRVGGDASCAVFWGILPWVIQAKHPLDAVQAATKTTTPTALLILAFRVLFARS